MAVKTLVIGIGSEGYLVCAMIKEKLAEVYGSASRAPWIETLVLETHSTGITDDLPTKDIERITISTSDWERIHRSPQSLDPSIDLTTWAGDLSRLGTTAPTSGANNRRALGRLCFLHESNLNRFNIKLQNKVQALKDLTAKHVSELLGPEHPQAKTFSFIRDPKVEYELDIYVVGTTTGGTGSGVLVDIGYFLKNHPLIRGHHVYGIFSIPSRSHIDPIHWANCFAALTELNHFHYDQSEYRAKIPLNSFKPEDGNEYFRRKDNPYDQTYIIQPDGVDSDTLQISRSGVAEFLFRNAVFSEDQADKRLKGALVNAQSLYAQLSDRKQRPMSYFSLGASVLEYPANYIINGCTAWITGDAIKGLLEVRDVDDHEVDDLVETAGLTPEALGDSYAGTEFSRQTIQSLESNAVAGLSSSGDSRESAVNDFVDSCGRKFGLRSNLQIDPSNSAAVEAAEQVVNESVARLGDRLLGLLTRPAYGPHYVAQMIQKLESHFSQREAALKSEVRTSGAYVAREQSLSRLRSSGTERSKKGRLSPLQIAAITLLILFGIGAGISIYLAYMLLLAWIIAGLSVIGLLAIMGVQIGKSSNAQPPDRTSSSASEYIRSLAAVRGASCEALVIERLKRELPLWEERINASGKGVRVWLRELNTRYGEMKSDIDGSSPKVSGVSLYEPGRTLRDSLRECLQSDAAKRQAEGEVLQWISSQLAQVFKDRPQHSKFDHIIEYDRVWFEEIRARLQSYFGPIQDTSVSDRLVRGQAQWQDLVKKAMSASRPKIDIDWFDNPLSEPFDTKRNPRLVLGPDMASEATQTSAGKIRRCILDEGMPEASMASSNDRHRYVFLEAFAIFSLYSIEGVAQARPHDLHQRLTREDIAWRNLDGSPLDAHHRRRVGYISAAIALGIVRISRGNLEFRANPYPGNPSPFLQMNMELHEASAKLSHRQDEADNLEDRVRHEIRDLGVQAAVEKLDQFYRDVNVNSRGITIDGHDLNAELFWSTIEEIVGTYPGMTDEWHRVIGYKPPDPSKLLQEKQLSDGTHFRGYYCPCGALLAFARDPVETIPDLCGSCSRRLR